MYPVAKLLEGRVGVMEDDRLVVVWYLSLWLGVNADHVAVVPHLLQELHRHKRHKKRERRYCIPREGGSEGGREGGREGGTKRGRG